MEDLLVQFAGENGLELPETAAPAFRRYYRFLEEKGKVMNLTAITGEENVYTLHFMDCLAIAAGRKMEGCSAIDIGSGAGFPGLPLRIAVPGLRLTLLDAQKKRVDFLRELCQQLGMDDVRCVHARAEESAFDGAMRERYDYALSRAVARLNLLCELCLPFVIPGGQFIAMKGTDSDEEISEAQTAIQTLGGCLEKVEDYTVPGTDVRHRLVIIRKKGSTPSGYPRKYAKISRSPLV